MSSRWREFGGVKKPAPALRKAETCPFCKRVVIWARFRPSKVRSGGRAFVSFPVEKCEPGTGDIALTSGLFRDFRAADLQEPLLAERVGTGTGYRSHRDHCPSFPSTSTKHATTPATASKSFSTFQTKKKRGSR